MPSYVGLLGPTQHSGDLPDRSGGSFFFAGLFLYSGCKSQAPLFCFREITYVKFQSTSTPFAPAPIASAIEQLAFPTEFVIRALAQLAQILPMTCFSEFFLPTLILYIYANCHQYWTLSNVQDALDAIEHSATIPYLLSFHVFRINLDFFAEEVNKIEREFMVRPSYSSLKFYRTLTHT